MVCPYCSHRNLNTALICNQCGIILRLGRTTRLIPSGGGGGLSFMRGLFPGGRLKGQHAALQARVTELTTQIGERGEEELKDPMRAASARLTLSALYLLQGEIEKSIHWFQQARQMKAAEPEFFNNAAVALARRGSLPQASELLDQAIRLAPGVAAPHANLAHLFTEAGAEPDPENAVAAITAVERALALDPKNLGLRNRLGLILCRERRYAEAVPQFEQLLSVGNSAAQADAQNNLGLAQALSGDLAAAREAFDAALRFDPSHAHALSNSALLATLDAMTGAGLEKLARATRIDPHSAAVRGNHGYGLCRIGAINDGILELKEALGLNSQLFEVSYNMGKAYADGEAYDVAERYLSRALQTSPHSGEVLTALGVVRTQQRQFPTAVAHFRAAVEIWPQLALARANLGVALGLSGELDEAALHLRKAGEIDVKDAHIPAQIAWVQLMKDNISSGLEELGLSVSLDEHIPEVQNNYGLCYIALDKPDLSFPHFKKALDLKPDFHAVHYQWGYAHAKLKNFEAAMREWDLTAKHEPTNADGHVNRGVVFYQKGQIDEAIAEFRHVIALRQTRMEDFSNCGLAYARAGMTLTKSAKNPQDPRFKQAQERQKQAIDMFDRALVLEPSNVMLHSNRGLACFFAGRAEDAMQEWGLVARIDPAYARRRGKKQQSEFDDSQIILVPFLVSDRAVSIPPKTGPYLPRFVSGYDTDEWELILSNPDLAKLPEMRRELHRLERELAAQGGK